MGAVEGGVGRRDQAVAQPFPIKRRLRPVRLPGGGDRDFERLAVDRLDVRVIIEGVELPVLSWATWLAVGLGVRPGAPGGAEDWAQHGNYQLVVRADRGRVEPDHSANLREVGEHMVDLRDRSTASPGHITARRVRVCHRGVNWEVVCRGEGGERFPCNIRLGVVKLASH